MFCTVAHTFVIVLRIKSCDIFTTNTSIFSFWFSPSSPAPIPKLQCCRHYGGGVNLRHFRPPFINLKRRLSGHASGSPVFYHGGPITWPLWRELRLVSQTRCTQSTERIARLTPPRQEMMLRAPTTLRAAAAGGGCCAQWASTDFSLFLHRYRSSASASASSVCVCSGSASASSVCV